MNDLQIFLSNLIVILMMGSTLLLATGCLAMFVTTSPIHRQRVGELTIAATLIWIVLAVAPLPRLLPQFNQWARGKLTREDSVTKTNSSFEQHVPKLGESSASNDQPLNGPEVQKCEIVIEELPLSAESEAIDVSLIDIDDFASVIPTSQGQPVEEFAATSSPRNRSPFVVKLALWIYGLGFLGCLLWLVLGHVLLANIRLRGRSPAPWLNELFSDLARETNSSRVQLIVSPTCQRAMSWGAIWPVIVLPETLCQRTNEAQLRVILLHELGHTVQGDAWGNLLLTLAFPLLYAQPLFWWLRSQIRLVAELVADDFAARQTGKETYALELIALAKSARGVGVLWGATGVVSSPTQFYRRMQMLIARETPLTLQPSAAWRWLSLCSTGLGVVLTAALLGIQPAEGQQESVNLSDKHDIAAQQTTSSNPAEVEGSTKVTVSVDSEVVVINDLVTDQQISVEVKPATEVVIESNPTSTTPAANKTADSSKLDKLIAEFNELYKQGRFDESVVIAKKAKEQFPKDPAIAVMVIKSQLALQNQFNKDAKDGGDAEEREIVVRSADGKDVEIFIKENGKSSRLSGKRFQFRGNRFMSMRGEDVQITETLPDQRPDSPTGVENPSPDRRPMSREKPPKVYPVLKRGDDGRLWIEIVKETPGEERQINERFPLPEKLVDEAHQMQVEAAVKMGLDQMLPGKPIRSKRSGPPEDVLNASKQDSAKPVDLVSLATSVADALSAIETATDPETQRRAKRKADLLIRMARIEFKAVSDECEQFQQLYESGRAPRHALTERQARRDMLREILETAPKSEDAPPATELKKF